MDYVSTVEEPVQHLTVTRQQGKLQGTCFLSHVFALPIRQATTHALATSALEQPERSQTEGEEVC